MATIAIITDAYMYFDRYKELTNEHEVIAFFNFGPHRSGFSISRRVGEEILEDLAEAGFTAREFTYQDVYQAEADLYIVDSWDMDGAAYNLLMRTRTIRIAGRNIQDKTHNVGILTPDNTLVNTNSSLIRYDLKRLNYKEPTPENIERKLI